MKRFKRMADEVAQALIAEGFTVHRYDAVKTESVYLKLDYGACNSIRISDHPGYPHLKYRYNIGTWIERQMETEDTYPRFYWPADQAGEMVARCVADREARKEWSGKGGYGQIVAKKKREARAAKTGFWAHARKVKGKQRKQTEYCEEAKK